MHFGFIQLAVCHLLILEPNTAMDDDIAHLLYVHSAFQPIVCAMIARFCWWAVWYFRSGFEPVFWLSTAAVSACLTLINIYVVVQIARVGCRSREVKQSKCSFALCGVVDLGKGSVLWFVLYLLAVGAWFSMSAVGVKESVIGNSTVIESWDVCQTSTVDSREEDTEMCAQHAIVSFYGHGAISNLVMFLGGLIVCVVAKSPVRHSAPMQLYVRGWGIDAPTLHSKVAQIFQPFGILQKAELHRGYDNKGVQFGWVLATMEDDEAAKNILAAFRNSRSRRFHVKDFDAKRNQCKDRMRKIKCEDLTVVKFKQSWADRHRLGALCLSCNDCKLTDAAAETICNALLKSVTPRRLSLRKHGFGSYGVKRLAYGLRVAALRGPSLRVNELDLSGVELGWESMSRLMMACNRPRQLTWVEEFKQFKHEESNTFTCVLVSVILAAFGHFSCQIMGALGGDEDFGNSTNSSLAEPDSGSAAGAFSDEQCTTKELVFYAAGTLFALAMVKIGIGLAQMCKKWFAIERLTRKSNELQRQTAQPNPKAQPNNNPGESDVKLAQMCKKWFAIERLTRKSKELQRHTAQPNPKAQPNNNPGESDVKQTPVEVAEGIPAPKVLFRACEAIVRAEVCSEFGISQRHFGSDARFGCLRRIGASSVAHTTD
eukprot:COSAG02_NODE_9306_length_2260_cov_9.077575_2_plen_655_part_01